MSTIINYLIRTFLAGGTSSWMLWLKLILAGVGLTVAILFYSYYNNTQKELASLNQSISLYKVTIATQDVTILNLKDDIVLKDQIETDTWNKFQAAQQKAADLQNKTDTALVTLNDLLTKRPELMNKILNLQSGTLENCLSLYGGTNIKDIEPNATKSKILLNACGLESEP